MAEGELVTIAHQDDIYPPWITARDFWQPIGDIRYDCFTTDYVIVKQGALITGDAMPGLSGF